MSNFKRECYTTSVSNTFKETAQDTIDLSKHVYEPREVPIPKSTAVKHDQGKPDMTMVPFCALEEVARTLGHGKNKYGRNNYKTGINTTRLAASALRHLGSWCDGIDLDSESGEQHVAHAAANLLMLLWTIKNKPELDDRN